MRSFLNPKWLFVINTLPIAVLFIIFYGQYSIIKTLLSEENIQLWLYFGLTIGVLALSNFGYAVYLTLRKQSVALWYGFLALFVGITYIYLYVYFIGDIIPSDVPRWMVPDNIFLYVGTFLMPTLVYSLCVVVAYFTPETKEHNAPVNFLLAISIPVMGYLFSQIILPLLRSFDSFFTIHSVLVLVITATLVFLFFLIRGTFILINKEAAAWRRYEFIWKIFITIVLPLVGLCVNNGASLGLFRGGDGGIFGDFNNYWFYIIAAVNGVLLCLPSLNNNIYRLFLFLGRSITFSYTVYFLLVFLPFLPLSVVAIIAIGTGFLMLAPLLLFVVHCNEIYKDFTFLQASFSKKIIAGISLVGFLIIPAFITATYLKDKKVLNEALSYLYTPDYSKQYNINKASLQKTLDIVKGHKDSNDFFFLGNQTPYFSSYYNWLVLDNLTLSYAKIRTIEKIFFGETYIWTDFENIQNHDVVITNISTSSIYDKSQNVWKSQVDLEITNKNETSWFSDEYATVIDLPEACWISDYYLYVGDRKESGILAEKKSAMWVFSQIRGENRDPGILHYLTGNKVSFRVFPFATDEVRRTGIEFLHKTPITLNIDNNIIELGNQNEVIDETVETENVIYVSSAHKQSLERVKRQPYFHFLVDVSKGKEEYLTDFTERIKYISETYKLLAENAQISFVNTYVNNFQLNDNWNQTYQSQNFEGGFYLDRAIKTTLFNAYKKQLYPVIVVVTDDIKNAVLEKDFSDFKFTFPESNLFFNLNSDGLLQTHCLTKDPGHGYPILHNPEYSFNQTVLEYHFSDNTIAYLPDNNEPGIILKKDIFKINDSEINEKNWESALIMHGGWMSQILHPETSDKEWLNLVKYSFVSKIMTPVTSYLVVENEAQKAILAKKQKQVLSGNKSLDLNDNSDIQRMSEPGLWIPVILLLLILWYKKKRRGHATKYYSFASLNKKCF